MFHHQNQASRISLHDCDPIQGDQIREVARDHPLSVTRAQPLQRLGGYAPASPSSTFSLLANWTWSKCLDEADGQGDLAGTTVEDPNDPDWTMAPAASIIKNVENVVIVAKSNFIASTAPGGCSSTIGNSHP